MATTPRESRPDRAPEPELEVPILTRVHPQVFVTDFERAVTFWRDSLGFRVGYQYGAPPYYGLVVRDDIGVNLRHVDTPVVDPSRCVSEDLLTAMIVVRSLKPLFLEYRERGVDFHQTLEEQPWGARDFIVRDPDGNLIGFASTVDDPG